MIFMSVHSSKHYYSLVSGVLYDSGAEMMGESIKTLLFSTNQSRYYSFFSKKS